MGAYLAIDIGASSGRHILGWMEGGELRTQEVYRFPNGVIRREGHLVWDLEALAGHVAAGIDKARAAVPKIESLSIDTWGVDYVLLRGDEAIFPCYAYRDDRTEEAVEEVHRRVPFAQLYRRTGIQFQPFNTVYQLTADRLAGRLDQADDFLMIPEYLLWKLCGARSHEYTNATTGGLVSAETGAYDLELIDALGLPRRLFHPLSRPGQVIGEYQGIRVTLCATHDTASAVEGIPMEGENAPYISSGTWSLLGVKTPRPLTDPASQAGNWSNEGGVGYTRYQKNIMGMWLINRLREELCPQWDFDQITQAARVSGYARLVDANDPAFLAPERMTDAFDQALGERPTAAGDYFRCAMLSLADSYRQALDELERHTGQTYSKLYIVGGGARNQTLNHMTAEATGKRIAALPIEATALGDLKIQIKAMEGLL